MDNKVTFDYFYGSGADTFSFYRIPKLLFTYDYFKVLSTDAKVLYGLMLDRMGLSVKNRWFDNDNRAYIYFSIEDAMELLNCGKNKAIKSMQELDSEQGIGLIEKRRQGMGKANIIYVKSFTVDDSVKFKNQTSKNSSDEENIEVYNSNRSLEQTSRGLQIKLPEVYIADPNNNKNNNTEMSNTESNLIISADDGMRIDEMAAYSKIIRKNLELDIMLERYPYEQELLQGIYELILETVLTKSKTIIIASNEYPTELVKSKLLKLNCMHLEYVMDCLKRNTTKVMNIKKYLLATLFNAPSTISSFYQAAVNYDMPQFAKSK